MLLMVPITVKRVRNGYDDVDVDVDEDRSFQVLTRKRLRQIIVDIIRPVTGSVMIKPLRPEAFHTAYVRWEQFFSGTKSNSNNLLQMITVISWCDSFTSLKPLKVVLTGDSG